MNRIPVSISFILVCFCVIAFGGEEKRITLDGKDTVAPPPTQTGSDGLDRVTRVETPQLLLFPSAKKPSLGTVLVNPGGGYSKLAVGHEGTPVAKLLNDAGWDAAVLLYHVSAGPSTRELAIADAKQALELIRKRGAEFGLETKKTGAMGFSAGGHLTARLAHETAAAKPLDFMILVYPAYLEKAGKLLDEVVPPDISIFVYVAADDSYKSSSIALDAYCREKNIKCEYHLAASGGHGFGLKSTLPKDVQDWPDKLRSFLKSAGGKAQGQSATLDTNAGK